MCFHLQVKSMSENCQKVLSCVVYVSCQCKCFVSLISSQSKFLFVDPGCEKISIVRFVQTVTRVCIV